VTGPLVAPQQTTTQAKNSQVNMNDVLRAAEGRRPDVLSTHEHTLALEASAAEPLYRLAPTLGASAVMHLTVDPPTGTPPHDETAALTLTWTIFDAGIRYADKRTRDAQAQSQALDEALLRRSIATDVATAISSLRQARETYQIADTAVTAAKKSVDETRILYGQGLARQLEVTDANGSEYDAEVNLETAKLSMEQAYLALRQALGLDPINDKVAPPGPAPRGAP
jgi:outer membrane protein TolC